jgi:hypothetical protein
MNAAQFTKTREHQQAARSSANAAVPGNAPKACPGKEASENPLNLEADEFLPVGNERTMGLFELILKNRTFLHKLIRDPTKKVELVPRFLVICLTAFLFYGVAMSLVLGAARVWPQLTDVPDFLASSGQSLIHFRAGSDIWQPWTDSSAFKLVFAYSFGLIAASGVCLPTLYFYGLLSGVRMSMLDVVVHALKAKATAAVALIGILPIYAAVGMGIVIFDVSDLFVHGAILLGLCLPFIAGLWGTRSLYVGFCGLSDTMLSQEQCQRACFLRRLVFSWSVVYSAVAPVMIFTLWQAMGT